MGLILMGPYPKLTPAMTTPSSTSYAPPTNGNRCSPTGLREDVATWTRYQRMERAALLSLPLFKPDLREQIKALLSPTSSAVTLGCLALWAASHLAGVGEVVDAIFLIMAGFQGLKAAKDLYHYVTISSSATTECELRIAAEHFERGITVLGVAAILFLISKFGGKAFGKGGNSASGTTIAAEETAWFEVEEVGANVRSTSVPSTFKIKVGGRRFTIKPHAVKHMVEKVEATAGTRPWGAYQGQVEYPVSSLAGALEQAEARGVLQPLINGTVKRLGTKAQPLVIDNWELSLEMVNGELEVFHAVPRGQ
jgi:hypothetical protein